MQPSAPVIRHDHLLEAIMPNTNPRHAAIMRSASLLANIGAIASWVAFIYSLYTSGPVVLTLVVALSVSFGCAMLNLSKQTSAGSVTLMAAKQGR